MSIPAAPQIESYRNFVDSIRLERYREYAADNSLMTECSTKAHEKLADELWNSDFGVERDYFEVLDAPSRVDYLLLNREQLVSRLERYVDALCNLVQDGPRKHARELVESLKFTPENLHVQLEQLTTEVALLDQTHVLMDQHLRESLVEHDFDFTQADSYHITEYPKANAWFYSSLLPLYTAYFKQPKLELLTEYISTARVIQASEHPLLGDPDFARLVRLSPALRQQTAGVLDELTTAELMAPLLSNRSELGV